MTRVKTLLFYFSLFFTCYIIPLQGMGGQYQKADEMKCLVKAYKGYIMSVLLLPKSGFQMTNGQVILWDDGNKKTVEQQIMYPDLKDIFFQAYPAFTPIDNPPALNSEAGTVRNDLFLGAVYGSSKEQISNNLVMINWLPYAKIKKIPFNKQNGAAFALQEVVSELAQLPKEYHSYLQSLGTVFNYEYIPGTNLLSPNAYGIAIDLNPRYRDTWKNNDVYKNQIPKAIVDIFERHHFIWGGRWYHFDTTHFEYRPEFFCQQNE